MKVKAKESTSPPESPSSLPLSDPALKKPQKSKPEYSSYISKVRKQVNPSSTISKSSMEVLDSFIQDFFDRICREASTLMTVAGRHVLKTDDLIKAINFILPGELQKHAIKEAQKAIELFKKHN